MTGRPAAVDLTPECGPTYENWRLASLHRDLFHQKGQVEHLSKSIDHYRTAIIGLHTLRGDDPSDLLSNFGAALHCRYQFNAKKRGRGLVDAQVHIEDLDECIRVHTSALKLRPPGHRSWMSSITKLSSALHSRFLSAHIPQDLEDSVSLHGELLRLCTTPDTIDARVLILQYLSKASYELFHIHGDLHDLEKSAMYSRQVRSVSPQGQSAWRASTRTLSLTLRTRYYRLRELADLKMCVDLQRILLSLCHLEHPERALRLSDLAVSLEVLFRATRNIEVLEESINHSYDVLSLPTTSGDTNLNLPRLRSLYSALLARYHYAKTPQDLQHCIRLQRDALKLARDLVPPILSHIMVHSDDLASGLHVYSQHTCEVPPFENLNESIRLYEEVLAMRTDASPARRASLIHLSGALYTRFLGAGDMDDADRCIQLLTEAQRLCSVSHPDRTSIFNNLAAITYARFQYTRDLQDLLQSISLLRVALTECPAGHPSRQSCSRLLAMVVIAYLQEAGVDEIVTQKNVDGAMIMLETYCNRSEGELPLMHRLQTALFWADAAYAIASLHKSTWDAYRTSLELTERAFITYPLSEMHHSYSTGLKSVATDAASYAITIGKCKGAIEFLEQGRSLLWSHLRRLRPPLEATGAADPQLRHELLRITQRLEALTMPSTTHQNLSVPSNAASNKVVEHFRDRSKLHAELDSLRKQPGMERLFLPPTFDALSPVTAEGPVIIVNHSKYRCDVLIFHGLHDKDYVRHLPLDACFYQRALDMAHMMRQALARLQIQQHPKKSEKMLKTILEELWDLIGRPVRDALDALGYKRGSRVWWCPTSAISALPLHAAGPEISLTQGKDKQQRRTLKHFQDFYISSYTPTLSALLHARNSASIRKPAFNPPPSLLVIAYPGENLEQVKDEVDTLCSLRRDGPFPRTKILQDNNAQRSSVMRELCEHTWLHVACHGSLIPGEPFKSAFRLANNEKLTLADITASRIPNAEFAFLSACHSAEQTEGSASEEALQLAAAMQFCGYKSVIGTMWVMRDADGPGLVRKVYEGMLVYGYEGDAKGRSGSRAVGQLCAYRC